MDRDKSNTPPSPKLETPQALYRGLYVRIARDLGVDPSYVSRVARGLRRSSEIENALREALDAINRKLARRDGKRPAAGNPLKTLVKRHRNQIRKQWLTHSQANPDLKRVKLPETKRAAPILPLLEETIQVMKLNLKRMPSASMKAAKRHGRLRQVQAFTPMALVEEYNLMRRCVFSLALENLRHADPHLLLQDLMQFSEALDLQTQRALKDYLASA
jgi:hypothetical protein